MTEPTIQEPQQTPPPAEKDHNIVGLINEVTRDRTSFWALFLPALIACLLVTTCSSKPDVDGLKTKIEEGRSEVRALQADLKEVRRENEQILSELRAQRQSPAKDRYQTPPAFPPGYVPNSALPLSPPIAPSTQLQGSPF